jgi:glycine oxidase
MEQTHNTEIDVAVIGGGIVGLSSARELAGAGRRVTVFEMAPGHGASWAAAGMLSPWAEWLDEGEEQETMAEPGRSDGPVSPHALLALEMRERSLALYPAWVAGLQAETGTPIEMNRSGCVVVVEEGDESVAVRLRTIANRAPGFHPLTAEEARVEVPLLGSRIRDAVLLPEEGYADPPAIMRALRDACSIRGIEVREEPVLHVVEEAGVVRGVRISSGEIRAQAVLNAAGAWAGAFLHPERVDSVRPIRGQVLSLRPRRIGVRLNRVVQAPGVYLVPRADGSIVVGATSEDVGFETGVTAGGIRSLLERVDRIAPSLGKWTLDRAWSGLRPCRGGGPLIGPDATRRGLYHAVGLHRHGILMAPYVARRVLECMQ